MRFLVDEQLPRALAQWIAEQGHEADHVFDLGMSSASDVEIGRKAVEMGAVIISKDEDFVPLSRRPDGPTVVWLRFGNQPRTAMLARFSGAWSAILERLQVGELLIEVR